MENLIIKIVEHNSTAYQQTVELRRKVLRIPLGLDFTKDELENEKDQLHVAAYLNDELVGCLVLIKLPRQTLKMRQVAVEPAMQGRGIGTRLVSWSEHWAVLNKYFRIELHARKEAVQFYLDLAYSVLGDEFKEVGIPHYKMIKDWSGS